MLINEIAQQITIEIVKDELMRPSSFVVSFNGRKIRHNWTWTAFCIPPNGGSGETTLLRCVMDCLTDRERISRASETIQERHAGKSVDTRYCMLNGITKSDTARRRSVALRVCRDPLRALWASWPAEDVRVARRLPPYQRKWAIEAMAADEKMRSLVSSHPLLIAYLNVINKGAFALASDNEVNNPGCGNAAHDVLGKFAAADVHEKDDFGWWNGMSLKSLARAVGIPWDVGKWPAGFIGCNQLHSVPALLARKKPRNVQQLAKLISFGGAYNDWLAKHIPVDIPSRRLHVDYKLLNDWLAYYRDLHRGEWPRFGWKRAVREAREWHGAMRRQAQQRNNDRDNAAFRRINDMRNARMEDFGITVESQLWKPTRPTFAKGDFSIVPLLTVEELESEGRAQGHCVGSYWPRLHRGDCEIWSVREGEKRLSTLEIINGAVVQHRGRFNAAPPKTVVSLVSEWLANAAPSAAIVV